MKILPYIHIIFIFIATALLACAPDYYDTEYCALVMSAFLGQNLCHFALGRKKNWLGFELFFAISFFFVVFPYAVFIRPEKMGYLFFQMPYNRDIDTLALAVANLGYACYMLGVTPTRKRWNVEPEVERIEITDKTYRFIFATFIICFFCYAAFGGLRALQSVYAEHASLSAVGIYSYFGNLYTCAAYLMAIFVFCLPTAKRIFYIGILGLLMILILSTGSRQLVLSLGLILLVSFNMRVYRIRFWQLLLMIFLGVTALFTIQLGRTTNFNLTEIALQFGETKGLFSWDIFQDLIMNGVNLYVLVDYAQNHDCTWLQGMLIDITSPIPGAASLIVSHFDCPHEFLHGGELPTYLLVGTGGNWGSGTAMVAEAYRSFGTVGMCIAMYLTGVVIKIAFCKASSSPYWYTFYMLLVGHAIMWPRAPFLFDPRLVVWTLVMLLGLRFLANIKKEKEQA